MPTVPGMSTRSSADSSDDWDSHWDDLGDSAEGNPANRWRQRLILGALGPVVAGARILDIGSGQGELAMLLCYRFPDAEVHGVEYSAEGVRRARARAEQLGVAARFQERDLMVAEDPPLEDRMWATHAVCSEVLEHVDEPATLLRHARSYLATGCLLVVTVPSGPRSAFDRHIGHRRHFTRATLRATLERGGFEVISLQRAGLPFFNLYRLAVMVRGKRLIDDLSHRSAADMPGPMLQLAYRVFDAAFRFNLRSSPCGWQLVAMARPGPV